MNTEFLKNLSRVVVGGLLLYGILPNAHNAFFVEPLFPNLSFITACVLLIFGAQIFRVRV